MSSDAKTSVREKRSSRHQRFNAQGIVPWAPSPVSDTVTPTLPELPNWASERYSERFLRSSSPVARIVVKRSPRSVPTPVQTPQTEQNIEVDDVELSSISSKEASEDKEPVSSPPSDDPASTTDEPAPLLSSSSSSSPPSPSAEVSSAEDEPAQPSSTSDNEGSDKSVSSSDNRRRRRSRTSIALHDMLDAEIKDFVNYMQLNAKERKHREDVAARVRVVTKELFPDSQLDIFGSWSTDLALPSSDIDVTLCGVEPSEATELAEALQTAGFSTHLIATSKVPILRLTDPVTGVHADISFNMSRAAASAANMKRLMQKYPLARPLIIALKSILKQGNINEVYTGGLSSYSLSLMVISYLQVQEKEAEEEGEGDEGSSLEGDTAEGEGSSGGSVGSSDGQSQEGGSQESASPPTPPSPSPTEGEGEQRERERDLASYAGVGKAFLGFLEMYGLEPTSLDFENLTISVARGGYIPKKDSLCSTPGSLLSLEDPLYQENDVAKGTFKFMEVRELFSTALKMIHVYEDHETSGRSYQMQMMGAHPATALLAVYGCDPREYVAQSWAGQGMMRHGHGMHHMHLPFHMSSGGMVPPGMMGAWYQNGMQNGHVHPPHFHPHHGTWVQQPQQPLHFAGSAHGNRGGRGGGGGAGSGKAFFPSQGVAPKDGFGVLNRQGTTAARKSSAKA